MKNIETMLLGSEGKEENTQFKQGLDGQMDWPCTIWVSMEIVYKSVVADWFKMMNQFSYIFSKA